MVGLHGGDAAPPLSAAGGRVAEAPGGVRRVAGSGRRRPPPEVFPAARKRPG